jgi:hypothetical protein
MATITINAEYAARHCKARLEEIERQFETDKNDWFELNRHTRRRRGVWPFKYEYYPTDGELDRLFCGSDSDDWWPPEYRLRQGTSRECDILHAIIKAADVAERANAKDVTLDDAEIACLERIVGEPVTA